MTDRATVPVVAVVLLLGVTVALAAVVGAVVFEAVPRDSGSTGLADPSNPSNPAGPVPTVVLSLSAADDRLTLTHEGGSTLDVRDLHLRVAVDGTPLAHQPPVPFFAATGFEPGPTGPFNEAADPGWSAGETASVGIAGTNEPTLSPGATVSVRLYANDRLVASASATVRSTDGDERRR